LPKNFPRCILEVKKNIECLSLPTGMYMNNTAENIKSNEEENRKNNVNAVMI
jgi:hypothetical protein